MHLKQTYGLMDSSIRLNSQKITTIYDGTNQHPIEALFFKQIEDGVRYANDGAQPYMEAQ
jgi:hypothetical protein